MVAVTRGWFLVLRWRGNLLRDERRNIGVILVAPDHQYGGIETLPPSGLPAAVRDGGVLAGLFDDLRTRFKPGADSDTLNSLPSLHRGLTDALIATEPKSVAVADEPAHTLRSLFNSYVRAPSGRSSTPTKRTFLAKVETALAHHGVKHELDFWAGEHRFDGVILNGNPRVVFEVVTFAGGLKDWERVENDAGSFLFHRLKVDLPGILGAQPPAEAATDAAHEAYERVRHLAGEENGVTICDAPEDVAVAAHDLVAV